MTAGSPRPVRLRWWWPVGAGALLLVVTFVGLLSGPVHLGTGAVLRSLLARLPFLHLRSGLTPAQEAILWELRVPRLVLGGLVGAMLAGAGSAYQGVFRNPLADPYLLGVAAGAGLGATVVIATGPVTTWPVDPLPLAAFAGGLLGVVVTYLVGYSVRVGRSPVTLILAGVAVAAFLTAVQTYVQQRRSDTLREVYGWILGRLTTVGWREVLLILPYVVLSSVVILAGRRLLDVLAVGDDEAGALGLDAARVRAVVIAAATLGTAAAVAVSGLIGFVGIVVPHTVRLLVGTSYRVVVPMSLLLGAAFLMAADLVARTVVAPAELPIGVVTAFVGAPFFALVLKTGRGTGT